MWTNGVCLRVCMCMSGLEWKAMKADITKKKGKRSNPGNTSIHYLNWWCVCDSVCVHAAHVYEWNETCQTKNCLEGLRKHECKYDTCKNTIPRLHSWFRHTSSTVLIPMSLTSSTAFFVSIFFFAMSSFGNLTCLLDLICLEIMKSDM